MEYFVIYKFFENIDSVPEGFWSLLTTCLTGVFTIVAASIAFLDARSVSIKEKKIQSRVEQLNRLEDKTFEVAKNMRDIGNNLGLQFVATSLSKTYEYTPTYYDSKQALGAFIRIYLPKLNDLYTKYDKSIYEFHLLHSQKQIDIEKVTEKYSEFASLQTELFWGLTSEIENLRKEISSILK